MSVDFNIDKKKDDIKKTRTSRTSIQVKVKQFHLIIFRPL